MKLKRLVAFLLVMTMTAGALPSLVFADENDNAPTETKVVESSEPEETKPAKPAETKPAETTVKETEKPAETKPVETAPEETSPAETTKPESTEPAGDEAPKNETPDATEPDESGEKTPDETIDGKSVRSGKKNADEPEVTGTTESGDDKKGTTKNKEVPAQNYKASQKSDNDELFRQYIQKKLTVSKNNSKKSSKSASAGSTLSGNDKIFYDSLKSQIALVADGSRTSTVFEVTLADLGLSAKTTFTAEQLGVQVIFSDGDVTNEAANAISAKVGCDLTRVIKALLADCPYELYWFNKTEVTSLSEIFFGYDVGSEEDTSITVTWSSPVRSVSFPVVQSYAAGTYQTDPSQINRVNTAISNAASIVDSAKNKSDYEKLVFYRNEICSRVAYNSAAATNSSTPFGDPWQLISVFDNDSSTDVVCEGYSKAFKYLCDQSSFKKDVNCITVTGTMSGGTGSGPHMWNIVTMDDGKNYLIDVTNCDGNSIGAPDLLFLKGYASGNVNDGYIFNCNSSNVSFVYDSDTKGLYSNEQLTISGTDYNATGTIVGSGTCGANLTWTVDDRGTLTISGTGAMTDWTTPDNLPWKQLRYDITEIVISDGVKTIGNLAFCGLQNVKSVSVPQGLTSIGNGAFQNCAMTGINIPSSVTVIGSEAFYGCAYLKSLTIPEKVESIGDRAFALCSGLETVVIPEELTSIGAGAFSDCSGLVSVILNRDAYSQTAFPGIPTSKLHFYYKVTYQSGSNGTVSGKTMTYGTDTVEFEITPASGYVLKKLTWSTATGTPAELQLDTDNKCVMPDSNDDITIVAYFRSAAGIVLSGNSVYRTKASTARVRFNSSESGTFYYIVNANNTAPSAADIKSASSGVCGNGTAVAGTNSIDLTGMSSGKQYCHVMVDDEGFLSNVLTIPMPYDVYYFEDFESYPLDAYITTGALSPIEQMTYGTGYEEQKVANSITSGKMLSLTSIGGASDQIVILNDKIPSSGRYVFEGDVATIKSSDETDKWLLRFSLTNGSYNKGNEAGIKFQNNGVIDANTELVKIKDSFTKDTWYHIKIELYPGLGFYYVYVDGVKSQAFEMPSGLNRLAFSSGHSFSAYFDNLKFYSEPDQVPEITTWAELQIALKNGGTVKLTQDIADTSNGGELVIPEKVTTVLDLNGYVIDRKGNGNGNLFWVVGNLTINDSNPDRTHSPAISYRNPVGGDTVVVKGGVLTGATACAIIGTYDSTITMNGGTVCGNRSYDARGGAIDLTGSVFNMYGGAIVNNYTPESGGAVRVYEGSVFNMYGGKIAHNTADKTGGGIYVYNNQSTTSILNMSGGEITENVSASIGAGVNIDNRGRLNISGTAKIKDNKKGAIENNVWGSIYVSGALEDGAKIGVSTYYDPTQNDPQQITFGGYDTYNNGEDPSKYFFSDKGFGVGLVTQGTSAGEVQLEFHINTWADLQTALDQGGTVKLTKDITAGAGDTQLYVNKTVVLDLNGYIINRNLSSPADGGGVIFVDEPGNLTITDSRPEATHSPAIKYKELKTGNDVIVNGGMITGGYSKGYAGGIRFKWSTGTMNGGTIVGNKATGEDSFDNAGGVLLYCSDFTMNGGAICGNEAIFGGNETNNIAAGVSINNRSGRPCNLNVNSGTITANYTNNTNNCCMGGIYNHASNVNVSGKAYIYGNMKNGEDNNVRAENNYGDSYSARVVRLSGKLTDGARIGVTTWRIPPYNYTEDFTNGFATYNPGENPSKYFSLDDEKLIMVFDDATEAKAALKFTVTLSNDGNGSASVTPTDIYYDLHPTLVATPKTGYVLKEWQVLKGKATIDKDNRIHVEAEDSNNPVTDIQIKAVFEKQKFTVTFADGTSTLSTASVTYGEKVTKPADPPKTGYRFIGWYSDPEFNYPYVFDTAITGDTTIYANYIQEFTVTVTSGKAEPSNAIAGEVVTVTADAAPSGSVFDKWEAAPGTVIFTDPNSASTTFNMPAGNVEIKATYKVKSGTCGDSGSDLTWDLDYTTGTLTVSGTGNMANWGDTDAVPWYKAKESIKSVVIAEGVTSIGDRAFNGYSNLAKVTIAGTVETIGYWAFNNCTNLERIELPEGVTSLSGGVFYGCTGLKSVTIPGSVTSIGDNVFNGCTSLTEVTYTGTKEKWDSISIGSGNESLTGAAMHFAKSDNTLSVKGKTATVKYKKLRKKKQTLTAGKVISFTNRGQGTLTYVKVSGNKKISINSKTGAVTIKKKGLKKKKTYTVKVRVMAAGDSNYNASTWNYVTFKIKVK